MDEKKALEIINSNPHIRRAMDDPDARTALALAATALSFVAAVRPAVDHLIGIYGARPISAPPITPER